MPSSVGSRVRSAKALTAYAQAPSEVRSSIDLRAARRQAARGRISSGACSRLPIARIHVSGLAGLALSNCSRAWSSLDLDNFRFA